MQSLPVLSSDSRCSTQPRLLDQIEIAAPCSASWDAMRGDDKARHCGSCQKNVYNLAGMTSVEAERLIFETQGDLCVRLFRRKDGTVITSDCPVGLAERSWRRARNTALASMSLVVVLVTGAIVALFGTTRAVKVIETSEHIQTKIEVLVDPVPKPLGGAPMPMDLGQMVEMGEMEEMGDVAAPSPKPAPVKMGKMRR